MGDTKPDRPKVDWVEDRKFEREEIFVQVNRLPLRRPRFSLSVGRTMDEDRISRYFPLRSSGQGKIEIERISHILSTLLAEAEDYVQSELQYNEDTFQENRQFHEARGMAKDKKRAPVGLSGGPGSGKTARKRANRQKRLAGESS
jgi:hypothetical protein